MNAKKVFERLLDIAHVYSFRLSSALHPDRKSRGKPGELLERLSPEEREELKNLTSEDIIEPDRPALTYMMGAYPENTTSVHCHSVKRDS